MNRRSFGKMAALTSLSPLLAAAAPTPVATASEPAQPSANPAANPLAARYQLTLQRVLAGDAPAYTPEFLLADVRPTPVRRFTEYSGDLSGRYIGALATAAQVYQTSFTALDALVQNTIALQKPDGYFGATFHYDKPNDLDLALLWGNGRLLVGLLEYYRLNPSPHVLASCVKLGDFLVRIGPLMLSAEMRQSFGANHFASSYICWMQQTEGLANLYAVTRDARYSLLAAQIAAVIERRPGDHVHGYLCSIRGLVDLTRATSAPAFLRQAEAAWLDVATSKDLLITGGVTEGWTPNNRRTEGCGEADWVRLSLALWNETGKPQYLAAAERAIFNELSFNQFATGDFGHRVFTDTGFTAAGAARAWWCCSLHGLRTFPDIHASVFRGQPAGISYDLPLDASIHTPSLSAQAESTLAEDGKVRITITAAAAQPASLSIRKPQWAANPTVTLNGAIVNGYLDDSYIRIQRQWSPGDVVTVQYPMQLTTQPAGPDRIAYTYGPWLLGAPAADNPAYFNELTAGNRLRQGREAATQSQPARPFTVPIAATVIPCLPAEFPDQPGTVTLRAIAEQAGLPTTSWELRFLTPQGT